MWILGWHTAGLKSTGLRPEEPLVVLDPVLMNTDESDQQTLILLALARLAITSSFLSSLFAWKIFNGVQDNSAVSHFIM